MNNQEFDIVKTIANYKCSNQRMIAKYSGYSLGVVNKAVNYLLDEGFINDNFEITDKLMQYKESFPERAVILAAGYGMRMAPINSETPKGLLEVHGERLIERAIKQLKEAGVNEIYIVVGFLKEKYEYLIDKYDVELIFNPEYAVKNNLYSMLRAVDKLKNAYVIPCDIWCRNNPFSKYELYSWYMVSETEADNSCVRVNRKRELVISGAYGGNSMSGITYLTGEASIKTAENILKLSSDIKNHDAYWEEALKQGTRLITNAKLVAPDEYVEINTYQQLKDFDGASNNLDNEAFRIIKSVFNVTDNDIKNVEVIKKGMTNRSFMFTIENQRYIMRIPGETSVKLINRECEAAVYGKIGELNISDEIMYINPKNGYKITKYIENSRCCNPYDMSELKLCFDKLKELHNADLRIDFEFDVFKMIDYYEELWNGIPSVYEDYAETKKKVLSLKPFVDKHKCEYRITHIDANPDNFLLYTDDFRTQVRLIDWEYAAMQDPHFDIVSVLVYNDYTKEQIDEIINLYFDDGCDELLRAKIYAYVSMFGLLWSNWCEYKRTEGVEFGEYAIMQYRYAKKYYRYAMELIENVRI